MGCEVLVILPMADLPDEAIEIVMKEGRCETDRQQYRHQRTTVIPARDQIAVEQAEHDVPGSHEPTTADVQCPKPSSSRPFRPQRETAVVAPYDAQILGH